MKKKLICVLAVLLVALTACGGSDSRATSMRLVRTEGKVNVSDDAGKDLETAKDLALYSGYEVKTKSESYAWINLDEVKLTKMDESSQVEITQEGKDLEIKVRSGSLFFNITEPLADDESMEIRVSTMVVGIRGTCGWVTVSEDRNTMQVWLLEGKVRCEAGKSKETVRAGEMAVMTKDGEITVSKFTREDIPAFVWDEVEEDEDLLEALTGGGSTPEPPTTGDDTPQPPTTGDDTPQPPAAGDDTPEPPATGGDTPQPPATDGAIVSSGTDRDITWSLTEDGVLIISGTGPMSSYTVNNYMNRPWPTGRMVLAVVIQDGVTQIGSRAFCNCTNLVSVSIPASVTSVGGSAFEGCTALTSISLSNGVTTIGNSAFKGLYSADLCRSSRQLDPNWGFRVQWL